MKFAAGRSRSYVAERNGEENVTYVRPQPALPEVDEDWRKTYAARQARGRPSNQARRQSGVASYPVEDGLAFGSAEELRVYRALKRLQSKFPEHDTIAIALWVPRSSSTSRDQAVFVDQATDASLSSDPVLSEIDRFG